MAGKVLEREGYRSDLAKKEPDRLDTLALRTCSRVWASHSPNEVIPLIQDLFDTVVQEDAFLLLAGYAMTHGTAGTLWNETSQMHELVPLEMVSLYRGFIAGLPDEELTAETSATESSTTP
jgi:hypothetical protein